MTEQLARTVGDPAWWLGLTLATAALFVAARVADRVCARRVDPAMRMLLYAPVFLRVAMPWDLTTPVGLTPAVPAIGAFALSSAKAPVSSLTHTAVATAPATPPATLVLMWALGAAFLLAAWLWRKARLDHQLKASTMAPRDVVEGWANEVVVLVHPDLGPFVYGVLHPVLVLPQALLDAPDTTPARHAIAHELAHLRRLDLPLAAALQLFTVVFWPLIPLWLASRRVHLLIELAADAEAVAMLPDPAPREYARTLLTLKHQPSIIATGGFNMAVYDNLRERITELVHPARWPRRFTLPATIATSLVLVALSTRVAASEPTGQLLFVGSGFDFQPEHPPTSVTVADPAVLTVSPTVNGGLEFDAIGTGHTQVVLSWDNAPHQVLTFDTVPFDESSLPAGITVTHLRRGEITFPKLPRDASAVAVVDSKVLDVFPDGAGLAVTAHGLGFTEVIVRYKEKGPDRLWFVVEP